MARFIPTLVFGILAWINISGCAAFPTDSTPILARRAQMHMGTVVTLIVVAPSETLAQAALAAGFFEIHRLETLLSTWIPTSELSRVNQAAGLQPVSVSPETMQVLTRSLEMARLTEGGFNIAVGPAVSAWNVTESTRIPSAEELEGLKPLTDLSHVILDETRGTVWITRPGMRLDVGGIGKGFAADLAVEKMRKAGAVAGVVALSGDIKTFGRLPEAARFQFGIQHPRREGVLLGRLELDNEAISTAGDYERFFERDGVRYHHILDPQTLQPARGCQSVTIVAKDGVVADGLDTGIFVMGPEKGMALIEQLPDVEGVIVDAAGQVWVSSGLKDRFQPIAIP